MSEIADIVRLHERRRGECFVLATLVRVQGSSYRRPGARMLIFPDGERAGSLSGGCLEEEVVERAREVAGTGAPSLMSFDTARRFGCHGKIDIYVERGDACFLDDLAKAFHGRKPCRLATVFEEGIDSRGSWVIAHPEACPASAFVEVIEPEIQIVIVGGGPDTVALRSISQTLGWRVISVAGASELAGPFDEWTAALVETHNYGRDFAALRALLPQGLRYIGLVGARRRREQLIADLMDTGLHPGPNLFAPAGLDLGADFPEQIALSIIAEIQGVFAGGDFRSLRERHTRIHPLNRRSVQSGVLVT